MDGAENRLRAAPFRTQLPLPTRDFYTDEFGMQA
jgi:hypothetical protein